MSIKDVSKWLDDIQKQTRYATAVALTKTAQKITTVMESEVKKTFDKPTKFIVKGFGYKSANKTNLTSIVYIKDRQAKVLLPHIVGGGRKQKPYEKRIATDLGADGYWVPGKGVKVNVSGNLTQKQIADIASGFSKSNKFNSILVGKPRGNPSAPFGIWGRPKSAGKSRANKGKLVPLLIMIKRPTYQRRFDFVGIANREVKNIFKNEFDIALQSALK